MVGRRSVGEKPQDVVRSGVGRDITAKRELRAVADRADHVGVGVVDDGRNFLADGIFPVKVPRRRLRDDDRAALAPEQDVSVPPRHHPRTVRDGDGDGVPCVGADVGRMPVRAACAYRAVEQEVVVEMKELVVSRRVLRREGVAVAAGSYRAVVAVVVGIGRRRKLRGRGEHPMTRQQSRTAKRGGKERMCHVNSHVSPFTLATLYHILNCTTYPIVRNKTTQSGNAKVEYQAMQATAVSIQ